MKKIIIITCCFVLCLGSCSSRQGNGESSYSLILQSDSNTAILPFNTPQPVKDEVDFSIKSFQDYCKRNPKRLTLKVIGILHGTRNAALTKQLKWAIIDSHDTAEGIAGNEADCYFWEAPLGQIPTIHHFPSDLHLRYLERGKILVGWETPEIKAFTLNMDSSFAPTSEREVVRDYYDRFEKWRGIVGILEACIYMWKNGYINGVVFQGQFHIDSDKEFYKTTKWLSQYVNITFHKTYNTSRSIKDIEKEAVIRNACEKTDTRKFQKYEGALICLCFGELQV